MSEPQERPDVRADEREQWDEPELVVTSLKDAMNSTVNVGSNDGRFDYS